MAYTLENSHNWIKAEFEGDENYLECSKTTGALATLTGLGISMLHKRRHSRE